MSLIRITAPTDFPVTVEEVSNNSRVTTDESDALITRQIAAATAYAERYTGKAIMTQTWEKVLDTFPDGVIEIELAPIVSVTSVKYINGDGAEQTIDAADYIVDTASNPARIAPVDTWPAAQDRINAVRVRFVVGQASGVNEDIRQAIILLASYWYDNTAAASPDSPMDVPFGTKALLDLHRNMFV